MLHLSTFSGIYSERGRQTWLESNWFSDEDVYQLAITQYALIPKDQLLLKRNWAPPVVLDEPVIIPITTIPE